MDIATMAEGGHGCRAAPWHPRAPRHVKTSIATAVGQGGPSCPGGGGGAKVKDAIAAMVGQGSRRP